MEEFGVIPVDYSTIITHLGGYKAPGDKVSKLEKRGELIRLKKGLFVISPEISRKELSLELIANHLYGPSYISYESALVYYGLIPESVYTVKSATWKRGKEYRTPVGRFVYISVPEKYFSIGLRQVIEKQIYAFIIASPEKALCDLIMSTSGLRIQSKKAMQEYLVQDLRMDLDELEQLDPGIIEVCIPYAYKQKEMRLLLGFVNALKN
ncbi:MAG: hypothetical protein EHM46_00600 [Bacteroidetes bacterium]|nr:MAG: hypothetical protein EHM46_00600 [Bacteroidota bacterium]